MSEFVIIGAGVAGLAAAWYAREAGKEVVVLEAEDRWGGLLDYFECDGFRFDKAVHFAFSNNEPYRALLEKTDYLVHQPLASNYEAGRWLKHPVQSNLYPLPAEDKVAAVKSFLERPAQSENPDYRQWLYEQFGRYIAERYPLRYTEKYWTLAAEEMSSLWVGNRLYRPSLDEVLFGAMTDQTPPNYYLAEFFYPRQGGYRRFLEPLVTDLQLQLGKRVERIDPHKKFVQCSDGSRVHYEQLVSSMPLPELVKAIDGLSAAVREAADQLWATSIALVSLGYRCPQAGEHLWFYIYDQEILPARVHAPYRKSAQNVPEGCSSLQFETYFSHRKPLMLSGDQLLEQIIGQTELIGLARCSDLVVSDYRVLPYANVVFDLGMIERRDFVLDQIKALGILPVGRFGEWDYLWSDQSYLSGKKVETLLA